MLFYLIQTLSYQPTHTGIVYALLCFRFVGCFMFYSSYFCIDAVAVDADTTECYDVDAVALFLYPHLQSTDTKSPCRSVRLFSVVVPSRIARSLRVFNIIAYIADNYSLFIDTSTRCVSKLRLAYSHFRQDNMRVFRVKIPICKDIRSERKHRYICGSQNSLYYNVSTCVSTFG